MGHHRATIHGIESTLASSPFRKDRKKCNEGEKTAMKESGGKKLQRQVGINEGM